VRRVAAALLLLGAAACGDGDAQVAADQPRTVLQVRSADDGKVLREVELEPTNGAGEPVLAGDVVLVTTRKGLTAYDLRTGEPRWTEPGAMLPAAVVRGVVVVDRKGGYTARRASDGTVLWRRDTPAQAVQAWEDQGMVLLDDGSPPPAKPCAGQASPCVPRPAARTGTVSLLDPETGRPRWTTRLDCRPDANSSVVSSAHVLVGCGGTHGGSTLTALSVAEGVVAWLRFVPGSISRTAAVGDVPALLAGEDAFGLDPRNGQVRWQVQAGGFPSRYAPLLDSNGRAGFLRDPLTGARSTGSVDASLGLTTHGGVLYGSVHPSLHAVRASDGRRLWSSPLVEGPRPATLLDSDTRHVVTVTAVGQKEYRD
jgi:outer membrane protein assembly factor BamB